MTTKRWMLASTHTATKLHELSANLLAVGNNWVHSAAVSASTVAARSTHRLNYSRL